MVDYWQVVLVEPAKVALAQISGFVAKLLAVLIIILIGWILSRVIKVIITKVLKAIKLDKLADKIELDTILSKGGITYSLSELLGVICYWLALLVTFMVAFNAVGLSMAADLLNQIILYVPNIIAAIFVIIVGLFVSILLGNVVNTATINAGVSQAGLLNKIVRVIVMVFVLAIALEQLNIGAKTIESTISIVLATILGSIGLGIAIAFGFGCRDIAARIAEDLFNKMKKR